MILSVGRFHKRQFSNSSSLFVSFFIFHLVCVRYISHIIVFHALLPYTNTNTIKMLSHSIVNMCCVYIFVDLCIYKSVVFAHTPFNFRSRLILFTNALGKTQNRTTARLRRKDLLYLAHIPSLATHSNAPAMMQGFEPYYFDVRHVFFVRFCLSWYFCLMKSTTGKNVKLKLQML